MRVSFTAATVWQSSQTPTIRAAARPKAAAQSLVNIDAERVVLGKIISDDRVWFDVADRLTVNDFGDSQHVLIFRAMLALVQQGRSITTPALLSQVTDIDPIDDVNLAAYLVGVAAESQKAEYKRLPIWHFAEIVLHRAGCRNLISAADEIKATANAAALDVPLEELRGKARALIEANDNEVGDAQSIGDLMSSVISMATAAAKSGKALGIRTGLAAWDDLVGPLLPGRVVILGGETSSGKTALAVQLSVMLAEQGIAVHISELEMEGSEIAARVLAHASQISSEKIIDGDVSPRELDQMMAAGAGMVALPVWIDSRPRQAVSTIQAKLSRMQGKHGVKVGVIDHLQYVRPDNPRADEREQIKQVADDIKAMAKRLQMPIILLSHVSRQTDFSLISCAADVKRPTLASLYGSSAIEKSGDAVIFVHRPGWFLERATPSPKFKQTMAEAKGAWEMDKQRWEGRAELVLPKRRAGKGYGVRECLFNDEFTWFDDDPGIESAIPF